MLVELGERMEDEAAVDLLDIRGVGGLGLYGYDCLLGLQRGGFGRWSLT